jgi:hypothetical protein
VSRMGKGLRALCLVFAVFATAFVVRHAKLFIQCSNHAAVLMQIRAHLRGYCADTGGYPSTLVELAQYVSDAARDVPYRTGWADVYYVANLRTNDPRGMPLLISKPGVAGGRVECGDRYASRSLDAMTEAQVAALINNPCSWAKSEFTSEQAYAECVARVRVVDWKGAPVRGTTSSEAPGVTAPRPLE